MKTCTMPLKKIKLPHLKFDDMAYYAFTIAVCFTALGPVVHYVFAPLSLVFIFIAVLRKEYPNILPLEKESKYILIVFFAFATWSVIPNAINSESFYSWGKGASVILESLIYVLLGLHLFNTEERCAKFATIFVIFNGIFCIDVILRNIYPLLGFNGTLGNGNVAGVYALLILPLFSCYALWRQKNIFFKSLLPLLATVTMLASFSSGAWAAGVVTGGVGVFFAVKAKKLSCKVTAVIMLFTAICCVGLNYYSNNYIYNRFLVELDQVASIGDSTKLTNQRMNIWRATYYLAKKHPIAGQGRGNFRGQCAANIDNFEKDLAFKTDDIFGDPHNMYLFTAFSAGFPGLVMLIVLLLMFTKRAVRYAAAECKESKVFPWGLVALLLLVGQIVQGFSGDIFDARRDIAIIFFACLGVLLRLPLKIYSVNSRSCDDNF